MKLECELCRQFCIPLTRFRVWEDGALDEMRVCEKCGKSDEDGAYAYFETEEEALAFIVVVYPNV